MGIRIWDFSLKVPSKWVFSGEHAVLRGARALAVPYSAYDLEWRFQKMESGGLQLPKNPFHEEVKRVLERGLLFLSDRFGKRIGIESSEHLNGLIEIESRIPLGAGLGSSAALSVAAARFLIWSTKVDSNLKLQNELATEIEGLFHGKSSGMDVAVIAAGNPIVFSKDKGIELQIPLTRFPEFKLYDSGLRANTRDCILRVEDWRSRNPTKAEQLDQQMNEATEMAVAALQLESRAKVARLAEAMNRAQECLETWGLIPDKLLEQKQALLKQGALSVKITGAGLGGFWISLWPED